jgi:hypothetical protein
MLIARLGANANRTAIRSRSGWRDFRDFAMHRQHITGTGRARPFQAPPEADYASREWNAALDQKAHGNRRRVPAARHQSLEECRFRRRRIKVERMRIELCGECRDLRLIERVGACHKRLTHEEIIEVEDFVSVPCRP